MNLAMSDAFPESTRIPIAESTAWQGSEAVYAAVYRDLLRVAFVLTGSGPAAEDVVQDVFAKVGPRIDTLAEPAAYLRVAVVNRCRSLHRRAVAAPRPDVPADSFMDVELIELRDASDRPAHPAALGNRAALPLRPSRRGDRHQPEMPPSHGPHPRAAWTRRTPRGDPMTSLTDDELAQTEVLLRQRLAQLATHAPTAVRLPGEVQVVAVDRRVGRGRRAGMITAIAALIGAGGFTTYSFIGASNDGGAATPQEAVTTFVSAMEREDVLGMIDVTLPQEVGALRGAIDSITSDAKRVGVLADDFDSGGVQGIDIAVADLVLETNFLEGGLAAVTATSGTVSASFDPANLRLGDALRLLIGDDQTADTASMDFAGIEPHAVLMTVEQDGRWYVSVEYTIAEYLRRAAGWDVPGPVSRTPVGFDSPEAAATGFYERLASLDLQSTIDTFAPGEDAIAWLAQTWMADAQANIEDERADGLSIAVSGLTFETIGDGDHRLLRPLTFLAQGTTPAGFVGGFHRPRLDGAAALHHRTRRRLHDRHGKFRSVDVRTRRLAGGDTGRRRLPDLRIRRDARRPRPHPVGKRDRASRGVGRAGRRLVVRLAPWHSAGQRDAQPPRHRRWFEPVRLDAGAVHLWRSWPRQPRIDGHRADH